VSFTGPRPIAQHRVTVADGAPGAGRDRAPAPRIGRQGPALTPERPVGYLMWMPEMARAMISRWISEVPSKMVKIFESRCHRSTG